MCGDPVAVTSFFAPLLWVGCNQQGSKSSNSGTAANSSGNIDARLHQVCCCMCCWHHQAGGCDHGSCHLLQLGGVLLLGLALHNAHPGWAGCC
jgi:hypothetical protein